MLALGACRPEEQSRILKYQKGVYLGQKDKPLSASARAAARSRTWAQSALSGVAIPGASRTGGTTVLRTGYMGRIGGQRAP